MRFFLTASAIFFFLASGFSQIFDPVDWSHSLEHVEGDEFVIHFDAVIEDGWYVYSQFLEEDGPIPTSINFDSPSFELVGKPEESGPQRKMEYDRNFEMDLIKFKKSARFSQKFKVNDYSQKLTGYLNFMTCNDTRCLPPTDVEFEYDVQKQKSGESGGSKNDRIGERKDNGIDEGSEELIEGRLTELGLDDVEVEDINQGETDVESDSQLIKSKGEGSASVQGSLSGSPAAYAGAVPDGKGGYCFPVVDGSIDQVIPSIRETYVSPLADCGEEDTAKGQNYLWTFILGFAGGLLALLTPCVFPMIPLTVSFFTKGSKDRKSGIKNGVIYGLSIIFIYVAIGLLITGVFGATALNELSTNWIANTLFFLIFVIFAISFFGYFEITLPSSWANKSDSMADQGGLIGIFFMAFTLALVSFSCTGPIIGSAIVQSATDSMGPFVVMLGFSSALALPFGLFAAFPAWLNSLPKSGGWMNSVKVVLGFLELALALKFLSVADMTMHWGILGYELFMGLWILIFAGLTLYLFGLIRFPHDSPLKRLSPTRWAFALGSLALTIYLATGFSYNDKTETYRSLSLMSGLAPPAQYNYFLPEPDLDPEIKSRYPSFSKCANNLDCFKDYCEGVAYAQEVGKPVFVDFTGYGCVNCRKTEEHIWIRDKIWNKLDQDFVLVSLYVDDRKPLNKQLRSANRDAKLRSVGNKWADFQIVNFEQNSQPLYIMMTPDQKVIAKPRGYKDGVDDYYQYLQCGLDGYKEYSQKLGMN